MALTDRSPTSADRGFAGQEVSFVLSVTGKVVATAVVGADGRFAATAPLPPHGLRGSDRPRYLARIGIQSSLNVKLARRMLVTRLSSAGGKVAIAGRGAAAARDEGESSNHHPPACDRV